MISLRSILFATAYLAIAFAALAAQSTLAASAFVYLSAIVLSLSAILAFTGVESNRRYFAAFAFAGLTFYVFDSQTGYSLSEFVTSIYFDHAIPPDYARSVAVPYTESGSSSYTVYVPPSRNLERSIFRCVISLSTAFTLTAISRRISTHTNG
ncbi:hypothetical protein [Planctomycetes bacterium CA13]|uniref:hypothetical protein n=1 Tax=Novipirellula herctigrandis TaxID=2527986 RepID=UPI0011B62F09